jgi:hypothetical protein
LRGRASRGQTGFRGDFSTLGAAQNAPDFRGFSTVFKLLVEYRRSRQEYRKMGALTRKREARKSLCQPGWITFEGGFAARQCVVQDLSSTGARISIDDPNSLPARLRLAFARDARTGRSCEVVWRRGNSAGIKFVR